ncbi:MAG: hypothetical protein A3F41_04945 [Coxiella sp. RIFCSPHIGHO2_12_FULL_44_14]|nr:MAG: hypothetical protein A3F41_04945 [Coxiella sp. RIFCSPHIGHO2_12_FULL_44_14]
MNGESYETQRNFTIWELLLETWNLQSGCKWPIWAILLCGGLLSTLVQLIILFFLLPDPHHPPVLYAYLLSPLINSIILAPFLMGTLMIGIERARGKPISVRSGFGYFYKTWPAIVTLFTIAFLSNITMYIVHLPSLVVATGRWAVWLSLLAGIIAFLVYVFLLLSIPLVADKHLSPWKAMSTSMNVIKPCWLKVVGLLVVVYLLFILSILPFFLGMLWHHYAGLVGAAIFIYLLIWLLPYLFLVQSMLYHRLMD